MGNLDTEEKALAFFTNVEECSQEKCAAMDAISESCRMTVRTIFQFVHPGPERTLALRALKDCRARAIEGVLFPGDAW